MKKNLKVAVVQYQIPNNYKKGEKKISELVTQAVSKHIDIFGLPEECLGQAYEGYNPLNYLSSIAKIYKVFLFGATYLQDKGKKVRNVGFLFNNKGNLLIKQDKIVLTPPAIDAGFKAGNTIRVVDTDLGRVAILVCKDSFHRYAAWFFDKLMKSGVDIVLVPSSSISVSGRSVNLWTDTLKTMAMLFNVFILAPGTVGMNGIDKSKAFGHALIIDPLKVILVEGSEEKEEILFATLEKNSLEKLRNPEADKWQPATIPDLKLIEK